MKLVAKSLRLRQFQKTITSEKAQGWPIMVRVLIVGAGSIGNHLSYACRQQNWQVHLYDIDPQALDRTQHDIFPSRYGEWDEEIECVSTLPLDESFDVVMIGTPPDSHIELALSSLKRYKPAVMLIEKPFCAPNEVRLPEFQTTLRALDTVAVVGYNHNLTPNTKFAERLLRRGLIGEPLSMQVQWQEHWGGIFDAHPWLSGPEESYLGFWERGGGACSEHSHGIAIWQYFSNIMGCGKVDEVTALIGMREVDGLCYDESVYMGLKSQNGLVGSVIQDVITIPAKKSVRIQGDRGFIEWYANYIPDHDAVVFCEHGSTRQERLFPKKRTDDFSPEIDHIEELLKGESFISPIRLELGIDCMEVISSVFQSHHTKARVALRKG